MLTLQENAVYAAHEAGEDVKHPMLARVRACSATPDLAETFFFWMLHPVGTSRHSVHAQHDEYLAPTFQRMMQEFPLPESHPLSAAALSRQRFTPDFSGTGTSSLLCAC